MLVESLIVGGVFATISGFYFSCVRYERNEIAEKKEEYKNWVCLRCGVKAEFSHFMGHIESNAFSSDKFCSGCNSVVIKEATRRIEHARQIVGQVMGSTKALYRDGGIDTKHTWETAKALVNSDPNRREDLDRWMKW